MFCIPYRSYWTYFNNLNLNPSFVSCVGWNSIVYVLVCTGADGKVYELFGGIEWSSWKTGVRFQSPQTWSVHAPGCWRWTSLLWSLEWPPPDAWSILDNAWHVYTQSDCHQASWTICSTYVGISVPIYSSMRAIICLLQDFQHVIPAIWFYSKNHIIIFSKFIFILVLLMLLYLCYSI